MNPLLREQVFKKMKEQYKGWSQADIAKIWGVSQAAVSKIWSGKSSGKKVFNKLVREKHGGELSDFFR